MEARSKPEDDPKPIGDFLGKWQPKLEDFAKQPPRFPPNMRKPEPEPELWEALGIPRAYRNAKVSDFKGLSVPKEPENLFIVGPNGTGKTHLAAALALEWQAGWCEVFPLLVRVKSTFSKFSQETEGTILASLTEWSRRPLVLDDLWAGNKSDFAFSWIMGLLNVRMAEELVTVVTCDRALADIRSADSSLASRIASFREIKLNGKDRRVR